MLPGFRDFPPECGGSRRLHKMAPAKKETVNTLVRRAGAWLTSQAAIKRPISIEPLDYRLNYDIYNDAPTSGKKGLPSVAHWSVSIRLLQVSYAR